MTELEFPLFSGRISHMYIQIINTSVLQPVDPQHHTTIYPSQQCILASRYMLHDITLY